MRQCGTTWKEYCNRTSLHGYAYLVNEDSIWSKLYWIVIVSLGFGLSIYALINNTLVFLNAKTLTYINTTTASLSHITFPSVFLCNINQVTRTSLSIMDLLDQDSDFNLVGQSSHQLHYF